MAIWKLVPPFPSRVLEELEGLSAEPNEFLPLADASHPHAAGRRRDGVRAGRLVRDGRGRRDVGPNGVRGRPAAVARDSAHGACCRAGRVAVEYVCSAVPGQLYYG